MKNLLYIFITAIVGLSCSVAFAAGDDWKVIFLTDKESNTHTGVELHKKGKKAFSLKFDEPYRIGFMIPVGDSRHRFEFKGIYKQDEKNFKYQDYLIDIKGNGDKRYLLVTNWGGGNHGPYAHGYLIDTKDNFAIIGRVPTAEICDYPMPNDELVFQYYDVLEYFTPTAPAQVFIEYKIQKGKMPQWIGKAGDINNFSLEDYRKILEDKNWNDSRKYALATLYCDLASHGLLKHFCTSAQSLGFSNEEIADTGEYYGEKLRKSKLYKYIRKLNGNLQIRQLISDDEAFFQDWISYIATSDSPVSPINNWKRCYDYEVVYDADGFVSYRHTKFDYTGGAHGMTYTKVGTLYIGERLHLADLPELDKIKKLFQQAVKSHKYFDTIRACNGGKEVKMTENFYIDKKGIHFIYDPYEIDCYASGTIDIIVPYKVDFSAK